MLELNAVKHKNMTYLWETNNNYTSSHKFRQYLFNNQPPKFAWKQGVIEIEGELVSVLQVTAPSKLTMGYELKSEYKKSVLPLPHYVTLDEWNDDNDRMAALYEIDYKETPGSITPVEFKINYVGDSYQSPVEVKLGEDLQYELLTEVLIPVPFRPNYPCYLSPFSSAKVLASSLLPQGKQHKVDSYFYSESNFNLKVSKVVGLVEPLIKESVPYGKRKSVKTFVHTRLHELFKIDEKSNFRFSGDNYHDLVTKIEKGVTKLNALLIEPMIECSHCKGHGVIPESLDLSTFFNI